VDELLSAGRLSDVTLSSSRAQRFPLEVSVRFRPLGSEGWVEGQTVNVSQSGVLFSAACPAPAADLAIELTLEMSLMGPRLANITCLARVVRTQSGCNAGTLVGARIDEYQFLPARST
jgi:hypothetical protein